MKARNASGAALLVDHRNLELLALAAITAIGTVLRLYRLGLWSFWGDEVRTLAWLQSRIPFQDHGWSLTKYLARLTITSLGASEFSARIIPAIVGALSIPLLYLPVKRLFGRQVALTSSLLLALSTWHIYWSQNARFYTSMLLFFSLALFLFFEALLRSRLRLLSIAFLFWGLSLLEQLSAVLFIPVAALYTLYWGWFLVAKGRSLLKWPWGPLVFLSGVILAIWGLPYLSRPGQALAEFGPYFAQSSDPFIVGSCATYYLGIPTVVIAMLTGVYLTLKRDEAGAFMAIGALVPYLIVPLAAASLWLGCRHEFVSLICWLVLASIGAVRLITQAPRNLRLLAMAPLAILVVSSLVEDSQYFTVQNGNRENAKAAMTFIADHAAESDPVIVPEKLVADYYLGRSTLPMRDDMVLPLDEATCRLWFIEDQYSAERYPTLFRWIGANTKIVSIQDVEVSAKVFKMRVHLYEGRCKCPG
jgi:hypothetical protein